MCSQDRTLIDPPFQPDRQSPAPDPTVAAPGSLKSRHFTADRRMSQRPIGPGREKPGPLRRPRKCGPRAAAARNRFARAGRKRRPRAAAERPRQFAAARVSLADRYADAAPDGRPRFTSGARSARRARDLLLSRLEGRPDEPSARFREIGFEHRLSRVDLRGVGISGFRLSMRSDGAFWILT